MPHSNCKVHGYTENVYKIQKGFYRCRLCHRLTHDKYRKKKENIEKRKRYYMTVVAPKMQAATQKRRAMNKIKRLNSAPHAKCKIHGYTEDVQYCYISDQGISYYCCKPCNQEGARQHYYAHKINKINSDYIAINATK